MKCKFCNSEWNSAVQTNTCPFCGKDLITDEKMDISSAIKKVIADRGIEVLHTPKLVISYVMDYVQGYDREKKLFRIACSNGTLDSLFSIYSEKDPAVQKLLIQKAQKTLMDTAFISQENADAVFLILLNAIDVKFYIPEKVVTAEKVIIPQKEQTKIENNNTIPKKQNSVVSNPISNKNKPQKKLLDILKKYQNYFKQCTAESWVIPNIPKDKLQIFLRKCSVSVNYDECLMYFLPTCVRSFLITNTDIYFFDAYQNELINKFAIADMANVRYNQSRNTVDVTLKSGKIIVLEPSGNERYCFELLYAISKI